MSNHNSGNQPNSGKIAKLLEAAANRLLLLNTITSKGALGRSLQIPVLRGSARIFRWWSRGWVGQVLGFAWCSATFMVGFRGRTKHHHIGDDWERYYADKFPIPK